MTDGAIPLVKRGQRNARYTAISNALVDHPALSPEARIVLIYLLTKPDNWQLQIGDIRRLLGTGPKVCGRNKTYEIIRELRNCAHVIAVEELHAGRFHRVTYYVFDEPHSDPEGFARAMREGRDYEVHSSNTEQSQTSSPCPENRDSVPAPCPEKPYPENRHVNKNGKKQKTESPHPSPDDYPRQVAKEKEGRFDFSDLWTSWPELERPQKRGVAERLFNRLTPDERRSAVQFASAFRSIRSQGGLALMIPYLRERSFLDFVGGPEIDREGYFVIRPEREEWAAWVDYYQSRYDEKIVADMIRRGFMLTRSRWPEQSGGDPGAAISKVSAQSKTTRDTPQKFPHRGWREADRSFASAGGRR